MYGLPVQTPHKHANGGTCTYQLEQTPTKCGFNTTSVQQTAAWAALWECLPGMCMPCIHLHGGRLIHRLPCHHVNNRRMDARWRAAISLKGAAALWCVPDCAYVSCTSPHAWQAVCGCTCIGCIVRTACLKCCACGGDCVKWWWQCTFCLVLPVRAGPLTWLPLRLFGAGTVPVLAAGTSPVPVCGLSSRAWHILFRVVSTRATCLVPACQQITATRYKHG